MILVIRASCAHTFVEKRADVGPPAAEEGELLAPEQAHSLVERWRRLRRCLCAAPNLSCRPVLVPPPDNSVPPAATEIAPRPLDSWGWRRTPPKPKQVTASVLTDYRAKVLFVLASSGPATAGQVADRLAPYQGAMIRTRLEALVDLGYVSRSRSVSTAGGGTEPVEYTATEAGSAIIRAASAHLLHPIATAPPDGEVSDEGMHRLLCAILFAGDRDRPPLPDRRAKLRFLVKDMLTKVPVRSQWIIAWHDGLFTGWERRSLRQIGDYEQVTGPRVGQLRERALRQFRHPSRSSAIRAEWQPTITAWFCARDHASIKAEAGEVEDVVDGGRGGDHLSVGGPGMPGGAGDEPEAATRQGG